MAEKAVDNKSFSLLSTVIPSAPGGEFVWSSAVLLACHEAFRREILRATRVFNKFDPLQDPWKAVALYRWLTEYLLPMLEHYENGKRMLIKPYYERRGHSIPTDINYSSSFLQDNFLMITIYAQECLDLSFSDNLFPTKIKESVAILNYEISKLKDVVFAQYDAEERFWPAVYEKEGLEAWNLVYSQLLVADRNSNQKMFQLMFGMIFHALGYNLTYLSANDPLDTPWCGPKTRFTYVKNAPFVVKSLPLVKWTQEYLRQKTTVNSIFFNKDDDYDLERRYRAELSRQQRRDEHRDALSHWLQRFFGLSRRPVSPSASAKHRQLRQLVRHEYIHRGTPHPLLADMSGAMLMIESRSCRSSRSDYDELLGSGPASGDIVFTPEYQQKLLEQEVLDWERVHHHHHHPDQSHVKHNTPRDTDQDTPTNSQGIGMEAKESSIDMKPAEPEDLMKVKPLNAKNIIHHHMNARHPSGHRWPWSWSWWGNRSMSSSFNRQYFSSSSTLDCTTTTNTRMSIGSKVDDEDDEEKLLDRTFQKPTSHVNKDGASAKMKVVPFDASEAN